MLASENENITRVYDSSPVISEDENPEMSYEVRQVKIRKQLKMMKAAQKRGKIEGEVEAARNLLELGADIELIIKAIGFQEKEIIGIKKEYRIILISDFLVKIRRLLGNCLSKDWVEKLKS
ncbi:hypothetical protein [Clostridium psychrophilum]|uniref:hypothetical protein n=1 Tax=Clostridium psychrophilum TaxID=132926 RepID=UPI001C0B9E60|nr:hypothetical protein [Clostridium psychrophilum]MBU3180710.1 hypothetical protein [Clostridium psychrophilum]